jgi:hypothetical protein
VFVSCRLAIACAFGASLIALRGASAVTVISGHLAGIPTPGLPDYLTYTVRATSDVGVIVGFNFDSSGDSSFGIRGNLHQVAPFGISAVFNDLAQPLYTAAGSHILADTHFLRTTASGITVNPSESDKLLSGAFHVNNEGGATDRMDFLQVVVGRVEPFCVRGQFIVKTLTGYVLEDVHVFALLLHDPCEIPEPGAWALVALAAPVLVRRRR